VKWAIRQSITRTQIKGGESSEVGNHSGFFSILIVTVSLSTEGSILWYFIFASIFLHFSAKIRPLISYFYPIISKINSNSYCIPTLQSATTTAKSYPTKWDWLHGWS